MYVLYLLSLLLLKIIADSIPDAVAAPINCALATVVNALSHLPLLGTFPKKSALVQAGIIMCVLFFAVIAVVIMYGHNSDFNGCQGAGLLGLYCCALLKEEGFTTV